MRGHRDEFSIKGMCRLFKLNRSGFYACLKRPLSDIEVEDNRLLKLIKELYVATGGTYGTPWIPAICVKLVNNAVLIELLKSCVSTNSDRIRL